MANNKAPLRILEKELSEIQNLINKSEKKCRLSWTIRNPETGRLNIVKKTDSHGREWPKDLKPEYTLSVDAQWIGVVSPGRYILCDSGRSGGKSWTIGSVLLARAIDASIRILSTREIQNSLKESAMALFRILIEKNTLPFEIMEKEIRGKNGSLISFAGLRDHSIESIKSYESYQLCWIEEAQSISERSFEILDPTIRLPHSQIIMSMNRRYRTDAIYTQFIENLDPPSGLVHIMGSYEDNPFLAPDVVKRAQEMKVKNFESYAHIYGGGLRLHADSVILKFEVPETPEKFNEQLKEAEQITVRNALYMGRHLSGVPLAERRKVIFSKLNRMNMQGVDFSLGGRSGINAFITLFLDDHRKLIFIKSEIYNNNEIGSFCRSILNVDGMRTKRIWADSAQPALSNIARQSGIAGIRPVNKSIVLADQLQSLQNYTYIINPDCQNFIDEISRYSWLIDSSGYVTDRPKKGTPDHAIDASRYALSEYLRADMRVLGSYSIMKYSAV
jgi:phage terminase large subunit